MSAPGVNGRPDRLVAYLRVSTDRQAEHGLGLTVQRSAISAWAKEAGARIIAWERDEGISGAKELEHRDGLAAALRMIRDGKADGLAVYRLDRLARDLIIQEQLLAEIWRTGGTVCTTSAGEAEYLTNDPSDPSRKLIRQVLGAVSEYERAMIALRMRNGREAKRAAGGYAGHGSPAYGLRSVDAALVEDEREAATVGLILELHGRGKSRRAIAAELNARNIPAKRGGAWLDMQVGRIITRQEATS